MKKLILISALLLIISGCETTNVNQAKYTGVCDERITLPDKSKLCIPPNIDITELAEINVDLKSDYGLTIDQMRGFSDLNKKSFPECKENILNIIGYRDDCIAVAEIKDNEKWDGYWLNGEPHGYGDHYTNKPFNVCSGTMINGKMEGSFKCIANIGEKKFYKNGKLIDGNPGLSIAQLRSIMGSGSSSASSSSSTSSAILNGGNSGSKTSPSYTYSETTVNGAPCPFRLNRNLVKQEFVRGNRICYYK